MSEEKRYDILSPDGFPIDFSKTYSREEVLDEFEKWKSRFVNQGYYSSTNYGRIPLNLLDDYCQVIEVECSKCEISSTS